MKCINKEVKEKYSDYYANIFKRLKAIKQEMKIIHKDDKILNYAHIGDLTRIDQDLAEILNYL